MWKRPTRAKKSRNISMLLICLTTICLMTSTNMVPASRGQNTTTVEKLFQQGLEDYKGEKWEEAVVHFHNCYNFTRHSKVSYCISCCYNQLESAKKALEFAEKALSDKPPLEDPFLTGAQQIRSHAKYILNMRKETPGFRYTIKGGADDGFPEAPFPPLPPKMTVSPPPPTPKTRNLTGTWKSNQGATYFIRQIGNVIWWCGESTDGGKQWTNVFHGTTVGNRIKGKWADVPKGRLANSGVLELQIEESGRLTRQKGNFGDTYWTRYTPKIIIGPVIKPKPVKKPKPVIKPKKFTPTRRLAPTTED